MSARIARGQPTRPKAKGSRRGPPPRGTNTSFAGDAVRQVSLWILVAMLLAVGLAVAAAMQVPQMIGLAAGQAVGEAGFAVRKVEIKGLERMKQLPVYAVALDQESMAMPLVDLEDTRARLLRFGWVQDARVSRRLPDTLVVDIVERQPAAVWQHEGQLSLVSKDGVVLEPVAVDEMPDLPLLIGPAANHQAMQLDALLAAAPEIKPMLAGATWVGGRRWDLRFHSGELLALPEGRERSQRSLVQFARMDKMTQLLGRGLVRFDMRVSGKFIVRVSSEPGSIVPAAPKAEPAPAQSGPLDPVTVI